MRDETYLDRSGKTGYYKIGHGDPLARMKSLQTGNPEEIVRLLSFPEGEPLERFLHKAFQYCQVRLEWFTFSDPETAMHLACTWTCRYREIKDKHPGLKPAMLATLAVKLATTLPVPA